MPGTYIFDLTGLSSCLTTLALRESGWILVDHTRHRGKGLADCESFFVFRRSPKYDFIVN